MLEIVQACLPPPTLVSTYHAVQRHWGLTLLRGIPRANNIAVVVSDLVTVVRQVRSAGAFRAGPGRSNGKLVRGAEGLAGGLGEVVGGGDGQGVRAGILVAAGGGSQRGHREEEERVFHFAGVVRVVNKERMTERYISNKRMNDWKKGMDSKYSVLVKLARVTKREREKRREREKKEGQDGNPARKRKDVQAAPFAH